MANRQLVMYIYGRPPSDSDNVSLLAYLSVALTLRCLQYNTPQRVRCKLLPSVKPSPASLATGSAAVQHITFFKHHVRDTRRSGIRACTPHQLMSFQTYVDSRPTLATAFVVGITASALFNGVEDQNLEAAYILAHFSPETRGIYGADAILQMRLFLRLEIREVKV
jgi:hypothetical protein